ncbi:hypothetical protein [Streptomyces sp. NPDC059783]|uniref:hypothetical protein n=1 Tax=Streptomyces sp. NPDC059783 TaxID=3346944 RepID=UPI0036598D97
MSAHEERDALTPAPAALYDQVRRLLHTAHGGTPPRRGFPLPPQPASGAEPLPHEDVPRVLAEVLTPLPRGAAELGRRLAPLGLDHSHLPRLRAAVAALPLPEEAPEGRPEQAAAALARELVRTGTTESAVAVGIALLGRFGEPGDVRYLTALGLYREFTDGAVRALDRLDRRRAAAVWLVVRARPAELTPLVHALWTGDPDAVREELGVLSPGPRFLPAEVARRIAEAASLPDLLDRHPDDPVLLSRAARLLVRGGSSRDGDTALLAFRDAPALYERVVARAGLLPPTTEHHATLLSLALDLSSGAAVLLDWAPGRRTALLEALGRVLAEPRWADAAVAVSESGPANGEQGLRARWIRRTGRRLFALAAAPRALRIEVVAGDPVDREPVETRILVDGRPLVPALFPWGPAEEPEALLDSRALRAGEEPHEVRLAEAYCTEGCCGALYVTVRRDGDAVVWENWRRPCTPPLPPGVPAEPAALRFDAAAYDAEIARAEADTVWSWPARTTGRLIRAGLVARPDLLGRWDARPGWISTGFDDPDTTVVTFDHAPGLAAGTPDGIPLQFRWIIPDDGTPPDTRAAAALCRLAAENPTTYADVCGGNRARAEQLGFTWPEEL